MVAISAAMSILGLMELPREDHPPREIWDNQERMEEWIEMIHSPRQHRKRDQDDYQDEGEFERNALVDEMLGR